MKPRILRLLAVVLLACAVHPLHAVPLVYEGFNYGLADQAPMAGQTIGATGLTGTCQVAVSGTNAAVRFSAAGLQFSPQFVATQGGALLATSGTGTTDGSARISAQLAAGSPTGTLWNSYLARIESRSGTRTEMTGISRVADDLAGTTAGRRLQNNFDNSINFAPGVAYGATHAGGSPDSGLAVGRTYLLISRFTNVGNPLSPSSPGEARQWVFDAPAYDAWVAGGARESDLDHYAVWTSSSVQTSGTITLADGAFLQLAVYGPGTSNITALFDEVRLGTDFADVVLVQPAATGSVYAWTAAGASPPPTGALPFLDSFEADAPGPFANGTRDWFVGSVADVIDDGRAASGARHLLAQAGSGAVARGFSDPTNSSVAWAEFYVRPRLQGPGGDPVLDAVATAAAFYFTSDARLRVFDGNLAGGGSWRTLDEVQIDSAAWVRVSLKLDFAQDRWTVWLDGVPVAGALGFRDPQDRLEAFRMGNGGGLDALFAGAERPAGLRFDWSDVPDLYPGIKHARETITEPRLNLVNVVRVDTHDPDIRFTVTPRDPLWGQTMPDFPDFIVRTLRETPMTFFASEEASGRKVLAAINASPFKPFTENSPTTGLSGRLAPYADKLGLTFSHGEQVDVPNNRPSVVVTKDWRVRLQNSPVGVDTTNILHAASGFFYILQNGARGGGGSGGYEARTGIGLSRDGRYLFLATVDDRVRVSDGMETPEFADLLLHYGAWNAINMDGGGSTSMIVRDPATDQPVSPGAWDYGWRKVGNNFGVYRVETPEEIPFESWLEHRGVPAGQRVPLADAAGDGIPNIFKYLFNIHPIHGWTRADAFGVPRFEAFSHAGQPRVGLRFRLNRHASDASLFAETSANLAPGSWHGGDIVVEEIGTDPATNDTLHRASIPASNGAGFLRLRGILSSE